MQHAAFPLLHGTTGSVVSVCSAFAPAAKALHVVFTHMGLLVKLTHSIDSHLGFTHLACMCWHPFDVDTDTPRHGVQDTWQQMEKLVEEGLVKSIGISNFSVKKVEDLLQYAKIAPAVNQVELHPYFRNEKLHKYCDSKVNADAACMVSGHCQLLCNRYVMRACTPCCQNSQA